MADHLRTSDTSQWTACGRPGRGDGDLTRDPDKVTCRSCRRTRRFANRQHELRQLAERNGPDVLVEHFVNCTPAGAAIVVDGSADDIVASMVAAGWTLGERVDHVAGKRIRLAPPPNYDLTAEGAGPLLDPDCRDGKCGSCVGGPCEHHCHQQAGTVSDG